jgi:hypothetical protein
MRTKTSTRRTGEKLTSTQALAMRRCSILSVVQISTNRSGNIFSSTFEKIKTNNYSTRAAMTANISEIFTQISG